MPIASLLRKRRLQARKDERGSSLVELVVSIPLVGLLLGTVIVTLGVLMLLVGQISDGAGATRAATTVSEQLQEARSCAEIEEVVLTQNDTVIKDKYHLTLTPATRCERATPYSVDLTIGNKNNDKELYTKTLILEAL